MNNLYLVGFMATGKSVVGRHLSTRLGWQFCDLDELIEKKEKRKIAQIFSESNEEYFREIEKRELFEISQQKNFVVACGGGIVLNPDNVRDMKATGVVICLSTKPEVILRRSLGLTHRPLLNVDQPERKIKELLKLRAPFYAEADYSIDTSDLSINQVVEKILDYVKSKD